MVKYKSSASKRKIKFDLDPTHFAALIRSNCHYCGDEPKQKRKGRFGTRTTYLYNGVDRVSSNLGYIVGNVVPACGTCNRAKGTKSLEEFNQWLYRVAAFVPLHLKPPGTKTPVQSLDIST